MKVEIITLTKQIIVCFNSTASGQFSIIHFVCGLVFFNGATVCVWVCAKVIKYIECSDREQTSEYAHKRTRIKNPFKWNERIESSEMVFDKASWRELPRFVVDAAASDVVAVAVAAIFPVLEGTR